jgi:general L-amino acid transport system substrate-binding protein
MPQETRREYVPVGSDAASVRHTVSCGMTRCSAGLKVNRSGCFRFIAALVLVAGCLASLAAGADTLAEVRERGYLLCGISEHSPPFTMIDERGVRTGLDIDHCKTVSAAVLGRISIEYVPLTPHTAFTTIQAGGADLFCGGATWTLTRDITLGLDFAGVVYYYGGQGFLVHRELGVRNIADLDGATICVAQGTTDELNLADEFGARGLSFRSLTFSNFERGIYAYLMRRCDAFSTNRAGLAAWMMGFRDPAAHLVLAEQIAKEPQSSVIRQDDPRWRDIVTWAFNVRVLAEELGVNQANVEAMRSQSRHPDVRRLLGVEGALGESLGLSRDFAYDVIRLVGNYQDIWDRSFGPTGLERGVNALWSDGGLMYALPMR